ncbi:LysR substrate-binding domain-containing protein [Thalassospira marina]|uniref:Transcriptional regulator n=1 Tax=Thalassospira marina TaxID=2048283 RepID=A0A2N3KVV7_9PROT|nr:LysR substrate-binding domain-containing protein [Thalassospira marina]PKR54709.1 transcriptional regulator [Thalassospira marina]
MALRPATPSLNALRAFEAAARLGSFARAASELSVTPGAVSQQVANLEARLGITLFDRNGPQLTLREAGRAYLPALQKAFDGIEAATLDLLTHGGSDRKLVIGALPTLATVWLIPRLSRFQNEFPKIRPVIETLSLNFATPDRMPDLGVHQMDVGLYFGNGHWPGFASFKILEEQQVVVAAPGLVSADIRDHARLTGADADILSRFPRLVHTTRPRAWHQWAQVNDVVIHGEPGLGFEHFFMLIEAAKSGMGIALLPRILIEPALAKGDLEIVHNGTLQASDAYYLICDENRQHDPEITAFRQWLLHEAGSGGNEGR